jgi:hypothetical protein
VIFLGKIWRRRPDLNRGWRFCRLGKETYVVDSSCFLVGPYPPVFPAVWALLFPSCSQVSDGPTLLTGEPYSNTTGRRTGRRARLSRLKVTRALQAAEAGTSLKEPIGETMAFRDLLLGTQLLTPTRSRTSASSPAGRMRRASTPREREVLQLRFRISGSEARCSRGWSSSWESLVKEHNRSTGSARAALASIPSHAAHERRLAWSGSSPLYGPP